MSIMYDEALRLWGAKRLGEWWEIEVDPSTVRVEFELDPGYACCGGRDPDCYCSFAQAPSADVQISGLGANGKKLTFHMDAESFDFATVLKEIVEAAGGTVTA